VETTRETLPRQTPSCFNTPSPTDSLESSLHSFEETFLPMEGSGDSGLLSPHRDWQSPLERSISSELSEIFPILEREICSPCCCLLTSSPHRAQRIASSFHSVVLSLEAEISVLEETVVSADDRPRQEDSKAHTAGFSKMERADSALAPTALSSSSCLQVPRHSP
jgi:hypothetical protein